VVLAGRVWVRGVSGLIGILILVWRLGWFVGSFAGFLGVLVVVFGILKCPRGP